MEKIFQTPSYDIQSIYFMHRDGKKIYADCQIAKYTGMVLILHGSNDNMVPLHYSQKAEQEYQNARLVVLPGVGHGIYSGAAMRTACKEIEDFVTRKEKVE